MYGNVGTVSVWYLLMPESKEIPRACFTSSGSRARLLMTAVWELWSSSRVDDRDNPLQQAEQTNKTIKIWLYRIYVDSQNVRTASKYWKEKNI